MSRPLLAVGYWLLVFLVLYCTSVAPLLHLCCYAEGIRAPAVGVTVRVEMNGTARTTMSLIAMFVLSVFIRR
jgi:hypothetical protein